MGYWEIIKLCTDTGLILSLVFLLYRFLRTNEVTSRGNSRVVEAQVARMLQEAEVAGRELSQVLEKRQRALKETLTQIESAETRIKKTVLKRTAEAPKPQVSTPTAVDEAPVKYSGVNIFGEVIGVNPAAPESKNPEVIPAATKSVTNGPRIRPEVVSVEPDVENDIQRVYDQAEAMLRAGRNIESVSLATRLSNSEVKMLSELVAKEAAVREQPKEPEVQLSGMRRLVQTV